MFRDGLLNLRLIVHEGPSSGGEQELPHETPQPIARMPGGSVTWPSGHMRRGTSSARAPMPWFVLGFIAMIALNSVVTIPPETKSVIISVTTFLLTMALAAMGLETDIAKLYAKGLRPLAVGAAASVFISVLSLTLIKLTS